MSRHYTDAVDKEDRNASDHVGRLLDADAAPAEVVVPSGGTAMSRLILCEDHAVLTGDDADVQQS
jgi:hypothetical protein